MQKKAITLVLAYLALVAQVNAQEVHYIFQGFSDAQCATASTGQIELSDTLTAVGSYAYSRVEEVAGDLEVTTFADAAGLHSTPGYLLQEQRCFQLPAAEQTSMSGIGIYAQLVRKSATKVDLFFYDDPYCSQSFSTPSLLDMNMKDFSALFDPEYCYDTNGANGLAPPAGSGLTAAIKSISVFYLESEYYTTYFVRSRSKVVTSGTTCDSTAYQLTSSEQIATACQEAGYDVDGNQLYMIAGGDNGESFPYPAGSLPIFVQFFTDMYCQSSFAAGAVIDIYDEASCQIIYVDNGNEVYGKVSQQEEQTILISQRGTLSDCTDYTSITYQSNTCVDTAFTDLTTVQSFQLYKSVSDGSWSIMSFEAAGCSSTQDYVADTSFPVTLSAGATPTACQQIATLAWATNVYVSGNTKWTFTTFSDSDCQTPTTGVTTFDVYKPTCRSTGFMPEQGPLNGLIFISSESLLTVSVPILSLQVFALVAALIALIF